MKFIRILAAAIALLGMTKIATAGDVYHCETVCYCNEDGGCVCLEICDVVEGIIGGGFRLGGRFGDGSLKLTGFPRAMNGQSISIPNGTTLQAPRNGNPIKELVGARVAPGKYTVTDGSLSLKIGE